MFSSLLKHVLFLAAALLLATSALAADEVPARPKSFTIDKPLVHPFKAAAWPIGTGLLPGTYNVVDEDANGYYYAGQGRLLVFRGVQGKFSTKALALAVGGVYVPKQASDQPRFFLYGEPAYPSVDDLSELPTGLAAAPEGSPNLDKDIVFIINVDQFFSGAKPRTDRRAFWWMQPDAEFRGKLESVLAQPQAQAAPTKQ